MAIPSTNVNLRQTSQWEAFCDAWKALKSVFGRDPPDLLGELATLPKPLNQKSPFPIPLEIFGVSDPPSSSNPRLPDRAFWIHSCCPIVNISLSGLPYLIPSSWTDCGTQVLRPRSLIKIALLHFVCCARVMRLYLVRANHNYKADKAIRVRKSNSQKQRWRQYLWTVDISQDVAGLEMDQLWLQITTHNMQIPIISHTKWYVYPLAIQAVKPTLCYWTPMLLEDALRLQTELKLPSDFFSIPAVGSGCEICSDEPSIHYLHTFATSVSSSAVEKLSILT